MRKQSQPPDGAERHQSALDVRIPPTSLNGGSRYLSLSTCRGLRPHFRMSENLTPFEHRLLDAIERVSLNLADIEVQIALLVDEINKNGLGDRRQQTLDQHP